MKKFKSLLTVLLSLLMLPYALACTCSAVTVIDTGVYSVYECNSLEELGAHLAKTAGDQADSLALEDRLAVQVYNNYLLKDDCIFVPDYNAEITGISVDQYSTATVSFTSEGKEFSIRYYSQDEEGSSIIAAQSRTVDGMKVFYTLYDGKLNGFYWIEGGKSLYLGLPQKISENDIKDYLHLCEVRQVNFSDLRRRYAENDGINVVEPLECCDLLSE